MRILIALIFSLPLLITAPAAQATATGTAVVAGPTFPSHGRLELTFTSVTVDPATGHVLITGDTVGRGTFGNLMGSDSYDINPLTGAFVGSGLRVAPDGSTFEVVYEGQFINATDSIGTYTIPNTGTGRFANQIGSGTFSSSRWASGLGSSSTFDGTTTFLP